MLRWSIVYVFAILFLMASATAGWMGFATREAVREIEHLEAAMLKLRRRQDAGRDALRKSLSDLQTARDSAKTSRDRLEQEQTAHRDTLAQLAKSEPINKSLIAKLRVAETSAREGAIASAKRQTSGTQKDQRVTSAPVTKTGKINSTPTELPALGSTATAQSLATKEKKVSSLSATESGPTAKQKLLPAGSAFSTSTTAVITTTTQTAPSDAPTYAKRRTITSSVNIRAKPSVRAARVAKLRPGQEITVTTSGAPKGWHKLVAPEKLQGYIKTTALLANSK